MTSVFGLSIVSGIVITSIVVIATVIGCRLLARRASAAGEIRLIGDVPPVSDWLPGALTSFVAESPGASTEFGDDLDGGILRGHRAVVRNPAAGVQFTLRMQPHPVRDSRAASHPFVIITDLAEAPTRTGVSRLIFGLAPTPGALATRVRLQDAVAAAARSRGMIARSSRPTSGAPVAALGSGLVVICLVATLIAPTARLISRSTAEPPKPWNPSGSSECAPAVKPPAKPPTRTAVAKGTSCAFAEAVRAAYAKAKISGSTVKLGKIKYDKKTTLTVSCTVGRPYSTCRGGKKEVYLG